MHKFMRSAFSSSSEQTSAVRVQMPHRLFALETQRAIGIERMVPARFREKILKTDEIHDGAPCRNLGDTYVRKNSGNHECHLKRYRCRKLI